MNVRHTAILLALAVSMTTTALAGAQELTLVEAIERALQHNAGLQGRRRAVEVQALEMDVAWGRHWPQLSLSARAQHHSDPVLVGPIHEAGVFPPLDDDVASAALTLNLPLYAGGRLVAGEDLARQEHARSRAALHGGEQDLVYNVVAAFSRALQLRQVVASLGHRIRSLESEAALIDQRVEEGRAAPLEKVRVDTQLSQARHEQAVVRQQMADARSLLGALLGSTGGPARWADYGRLELALPESVEAAVARDRQDAPAVQEAKALRAAADAEAAIARSARRPQVGLLTEVERSVGLSDGRRENNWRIGLVFDLPLFDGGVRRSQVAQAELGREIGALRVQAVQDEVAAKVEQAFGGLDTARSRVAVAGQAVAEVRGALAGAGFAVEGVEPIVPSMEDVFVSLIEAADREGATA